MSKRMSPTKRITKTNLRKIPDDLPAVFLIKNRKGVILCVSSFHGLADPDPEFGVGLRRRIWQLRGRTRGNQFCYRTAKQSQLKKLKSEYIRKAAKTWWKAL